MLAETGSVMGACEAVGMSRKSVCALRARPEAESFAAASDCRLGAAAAEGNGRGPCLRVLSWALRPVMFRGRYRGAKQTPDNTVLLRLTARLERVAPEEW